MSRPADLPAAHSCGTRAKYVAARCRCASCRAANSTWVKQRDALAKAAARELADETARARAAWVRERLSLNALLARPRPMPGPVRYPCPQTWTAPDGTKQVRLYKRACIGADGRGCPYHCHLRKDSSGDVCLRCRPRLAAAWNGLVPSDAVRRHLRKLSRQGVGYKSVAVAADVAHTTLADILFAGQTHLRAQAARRVLAVDRDAISDRGLVPADQTWRRIHRLLSEGFTKAELARRLGCQTPALQIRRDHIFAKTAMKVERLYQTVMAI